MSAPAEPTNVRGAGGLPELAAGAVDPALTTSITVKVELATATAVRINKFIAVNSTAEMVMTPYHLTSWSSKAPIWHWYCMNTDTAPERRSCGYF